MKIAICLPSYNESKNIENITRIVDKGLSKYYNDCECFIVNADNNSPDGTNKLFQKTRTKNKKISIVTQQKGKGNNLIAFFNFCHQNKINYAATIDSDVVSAKADWVKKLIGPQVEEGVDYVVPVYKRSRYEASTTNHFAFPAIYAVFREYIRQPIAGDFGFSSRFIELILKKDVNDDIKEYGIDIFMTINACLFNLKIKNVFLGQKLHNPSFNKMANMFNQVLHGFIYSIQSNLPNSQLSKKIPQSENLICITRKRTFAHKQFAIQNFQDAIDFLKKRHLNISKNNVEELYIRNFAKIIRGTINNSLTEEQIEVFIKLFIARSTSFWLKAERMSAKNCEQRIEEQAKLISKEMNLCE